LDPVINPVQTALKQFLFPTRSTRRKGPMRGNTLTQAMDFFANRLSGDDDAIRTWLDFVDSLSRPGGNITGFSSFEYAMGGKWLGTLKEMVPNIARVAVLRDPGTGVGPIGAIQAVMPSFALPLTIASGRDAAEVETRD
jgi:hypothetical protein